MTSTRLLIIQALQNGHRAVRYQQYSWKWENKWEGCPSLANVNTSALFRAGLVEEHNGEMVLSSTGNLVKG